MELKIYDYVQADTAISYEDGRKCLEIILEHIDKEEIILNFQGIDFVITAFLNPVIGDLITEKGEAVMDKVKISNANVNILDKIKMVKDGTLLKRKDMDDI